MTLPLLQAKQLACSRGEQLLWQALDFELHPGQLLQIIGANGSGKTSLLRILTGMMRPQQGQVCWQGAAIDQQLTEYRSQLCFLGHQPAIKPELTVAEQLRLNLRAPAIDAQRWQSVVSTLALESLLSCFCRTLSRGQCQRVALAGIMLAKANVWILDEPFASLDEAMMLVVQRCFAQHLAAQGMIVLTTHRPLTLASLPVVELQLLLNKQKYEHA